MRKFIVAATAALGLSFTLFTMAPTQKVDAMADMWPINQVQVIAQFEVVADPMDPCFEVVRDNGGYEIHGQSFDVHSLGSHMIPITFDVDRFKAMVWGGRYIGPTPGSGGDGARYVVEPGEVAQVWTAGACAQDGRSAVGMSIYPGYPREMGFQSHAQGAPVTNTAPNLSNPVSNNSNTGTNTGNQCPKTPQDASTLIGGSADRWSLLPDTNGTGWKFALGTATPLNRPSFGKLDVPAAEGSGPYTVATFWCNG